MLVEHQKKLKELKLREADVEKPELDQQELNKIDFKLKEALNKDLAVRIKFYENNRVKILEAKILKIEKHKQQLKIEQLNKEIKKLKFSQIIEVKL